MHHCCHKVSSIDIEPGKLATIRTTAGEVFHADNDGTYQIVSNGTGRHLLQQKGAVVVISPFTGADCGSPILIWSTACVPLRK
jgi:hypothetical protein